NNRNGPNLFNVQWPGRGVVCPASHTTCKTRKRRMNGIWSALWLCLRAGPFDSFSLLGRSGQALRRKEEALIDCFPTVPPSLAALARLYGGLTCFAPAALERN